MTKDIVQARTWQLLNILADGEFHSGEVLAERLGVSRASVFNALDGVAEHGVALQRIRGRGYRLAQPWQPLEREEVLRWLGEDAGQFDIGILPQAASSNTLLLQRAGLGADAASGGSVLAVELQTAGRGRLGRSWRSGLGSTLTFSLLWRFDCGLNALSGLSLAVGVAVARALYGLGARDVRLKWPNDILIGQSEPDDQSKQDVQFKQSDGRKLGGVLIEAQGDMLGPSAVVIGIGLNCSLPDHLAGRIDQPAGARDEICRDMPTRNRLLAAVLQELAGVLRQFARGGFAAFGGEWESYHLHQDQPVQLRMADGSVVTGVARGVSESGELCLETAQGMRRFNSGEAGGLR